MKINKLPPEIDINEYNKNKVSEEFLESCRKAKELFDKKGDSQPRDPRPAQPHEIKR